MVPGWSTSAEVASAAEHRVAERLGPHDLGPAEECGHVVCGGELHRDPWGHPEGLFHGVLGQRGVQSEGPEQVPPRGGGRGFVEHGGEEDAVGVIGREHAQHVEGVPAPDADAVGPRPAGGEAAKALLAEGADGRGVLDGQDLGPGGLGEVQRVDGQAEGSVDQSTGGPTARDSADQRVVEAASEACLQEAGVDEEVVQGRLKAAQTALDDLKAISKVFDENTPGQGPELDPVIKLMGQIAKALGKYAGGDAAEPEEDGAESDDGAPMALAGDAPARAGGGAVGAIRSPNDVANALDRIIEYYQRYEPSSPLPILLRRAKRLVNADFLTIIRDIAPNGIDNVNLVGGIDDE